MENFVKILLWITLALSATGCDEDEASVLADSLEVKLVTLDENGEERAVFDAGTDVYFALKLLNSTNNEVKAGGYFDYCKIYQIDEFLLVYKWARNNENEKENWVPLGRVC